MATINEDTIDELKELMEDDFLELIESFVNDIQLKITQIREAIEECNCENLRQKSHSLKGSARNIGAENMSDLCQKLEKAGKDHNLEDVHSIFSELEQESIAVRQNLNNMLA